MCSVKSTVAPRRHFRVDKSFGDTLGIPQYREHSFTHAKSTTTAPKRRSYWEEVNENLCVCLCGRAACPRKKHWGTSSTIARINTTYLSTPAPRYSPRVGHVYSRILGLPGPSVAFQNCFRTFGHSCCRNQLPVVRVSTSCLYA